MFVWLAAQLLAIGVGAARVPLWARFPSTGEMLALDELIAVQFVVSSLLFPFLCRDLKSTCAVICASAPMIAIAGLLSFTSTGACIANAFNLALWLLGLFAWGKVARSDSNSAADVRTSRALLAIAIIGALNLGGTFLAYFGAEASGKLAAGFQFVPLIGAIQLSHEMSWWGCFPNLGLTAIAGTMLLIRRARLSTPSFH